MKMMMKKMTMMMSGQMLTTTQHHQPDNKTDDQTGKHEFTFFSLSLPCFRLFIHIRDQDSLICAESVSRICCRRTSVQKEEKRVTDKREER